MMNWTQLKVTFNFRNKLGFSLASVLVASALLGILAIAFSTMIRNSQKGQTGVQNAIDFDVLKNSISAVLTDPSICGNAFKNVSNGAAKFVNPGSPSNAERLRSIKIGGSTIAEINQQLGGGLKISNLELKYISGAAPNYFVELVIEATRTQDAMGARVISNLKNPFRFKIVTDANDRIVACGSGEFSFYRRNIPYNTGGMLVDNIGMHRFCAVTSIGVSTDENAGYTCSVTPQGTPPEFIPVANNHFPTGGTGQKVLAPAPFSSPIAWIMRSKCDGSCVGHCQVMCF